MAPAHQRTAPEERWPLRTPHAHQAVCQPGVHGNKGPTVSARLATDPAQRVSLDTARAAAQEKARKLEKAPEVMSDVEGPAVDALRAELKEVQSAAAVPTLDVQIEQYESFISRSQRKLTELDKQRVAEEELLTETRARLERLRLEAVQCRAAFSATSNAHSELTRLRAQVVELQRAAQGRECGAGPSKVPRTERRHGWACPDMPTLIPAELDDWMKARQGDLQGALEFQETERVLELTSKLSDAAVGMMEMSGKMVP